MELSKEELILKNSPKLWIYSGQLITDQNSKDFSKEQRSFWTKAHQAFLKRNFYFRINGKQFITPFKLADGSFDSVKVLEVNNKYVEDLKLKAEKQIENEQVK